MFKLIRLALVLIAGIVCADQNINRDSTRFDYHGQSGQIAIRDSTHGKEASIKWSKIEEITPQGQRVNWVNNFASQSFVWKQPCNVVINSQNATLVEFNSVLNARYNSSQNIYFNISTLLFQTQSIVPYGNTTITVPKDSIKFTLSMIGWPFRSVNNMLRFGAELKQETHSGKNKTLSDLKKYKINKYNRESNDDKIGYSDRTLIMDGSGFYDMPSFAIIDGVQVSVNVSTYTESDDNKVGIAWVFPKFTSLLYDPVIGTGTPDYLAMSGAADTIVGTHVAVMIIFAAGVVFTLW
jgi:hypothetical protein